MSGRGVFGIVKNIYNRKHNPSNCLYTDDVIYANLEKFFEKRSKTNEIIE